MHDLTTAHGAKFTSGLGERGWRRGDAREEGGEEERGGTVSVLRAVEDVAVFRRHCGVSSVLGTVRAGRLRSFSRISILKGKFESDWAFDKSAPTAQAGSSSKRFVVGI